MTKFVLYSNKEHFTGYEVSGHSTVSENDETGRLVCSAVSSAVILTANTITDVLNVNADISIDDGYLKITINKPDKLTDLLIEGLKLHMTELTEEYKGYIKIFNGGLH